MDLLEVLSATYAVMGQEINDVGLQLMVADLSGYPVAEVEAALARCRLELRRLTLADIIARLPDGRPTAEHAWAKLPRGEQETVVWTEEMMRACGVSASLRAAGDEIGARLAFCREYDRVVLEARLAHRPLRWLVSLGWDRAGREGPIQEAVTAGLLSVAAVHHLLPSLDRDTRLPVT